MRVRGLTVHLERAPGPVPPGQAVPVPVAVAIAHAAREALANVAAHAGTGRAWVTVRSLATEDGAAAPG